MGIKVWRWGVFIVGGACVIRVVRFGFSFQIFVFLLVSFFLYLNHLAGASGFNWIKAHKYFFSLFHPLQDLKNSDDDEVPGESPLLEERGWGIFLFLAALVAFHPLGLGLILRWFSVIL